MTIEETFCTIEERILGRDDWEWITDVDAEQWLADYGEKPTCEYRVTVTEEYSGLHMVVYNPEHIKKYGVEGFQDRWNKMMNGEIDCIDDEIIEDD